MSHSYRDYCPCGDCTRHFNDVVGAMFKGKEATTMATKKKTLKRKTATKKSTSK